MTHTATRRRILIPLILAFCVAAGAATTWWYYAHKQQGPIYAFQYERDMPEVLKFFADDDNWYWLMPDSRETYGPDYLPYVFKYRAPQANPMYHGKLQVKIIKQDGEFAGFVAYYMKSKTIGMILFVAVNKKFRGRKLGNKLVAYAMNDLKKRGAKHITLLTRTDNIAARHIYTKFGFKEDYFDPEGFVYFWYDVK